MKGVLVLLINILRLIKKKLFRDHKVVLRLRLISDSCGQIFGFFVNDHFFLEPIDVLNDLLSDRQRYKVLFV